MYNEQQFSDSENYRYSDAASAVEDTVSGHTEENFFIAFLRMVSELGEVAEVLLPLIPDDPHFEAFAVDMLALKQMGKYWGKVEKQVGQQRDDINIVPEAQATAFLEMLHANYEEDIAEVEDKFIKEMGDLNFATTAFNRSLRIPNGIPALMNKIKLMKRFPNGFSAEDSKARVDENV